ncbi:hypothetical protein [Mameliella sp.]|uniref:DUF6854 domain-containing protein n=1 Tax=Mameliella sp. TaxID=1924940 RepID=UPI003B511298
MSNTSYSMITVARCDTAFLSDVLGHLGGLCDDLKSGAGALMTRYGVIATGDHAGHLVLLQGYSDMSGIGKAFDVYGTSAAYDKIVGSGKVRVLLRNILKSEDIGVDEQPTEVPAYGVLTRWASPTPQSERIGRVAPLMRQNGAMAIRHFTIMTGSATGHRLMATGYPSMDAIEKTYAALNDTEDYKAFLTEIDLDSRNIVRVAG